MYGWTPPPLQRISVPRTRHHSGRRVVEAGQSSIEAVLPVLPFTAVFAAESSRSPIPIVKIAVLPFLQKSSLITIRFNKHSRFFCAETAGFLSVLHRGFRLCFVCIFRVVPDRLMPPIHARERAIEGAAHSPHRSSAGRIVCKFI